MEIQVDHLTRVEGHGNLHAEIVDGRVARVSFHVVEANRFFEGILRGHDAEEVAHIASRICGICAVSHSCASLQASEQALGLLISEQTLLLRRLIMHAEVISSHALHVWFLAAPDYLRLPSVFPLIEKDPETVRRAYRLKKMGYELGEAILGRHTHPVSALPGGFTAAPQVRAMEQMRDRLVEMRPDLEAMIELYRGVEVPQFEYPTEYVSLRQPDHYSFYGGKIVSNLRSSISAEKYREKLQEYVVLESTAKYVKWHRESYMVGALARVNNNHKQLHRTAKQAMRTLGIKPPCHNPFMNTHAQAVELVHCVEESIELIEMLLSRGIEDQWEPEYEARAGCGVGVVEAPRGLLVHDYSYDEHGRCTAANCIIPTNQNLANLNANLQAFLPQIVDQPPAEIQRQLEMLVRAYDPCISCSVH